MNKPIILGMIWRPRMEFERIRMQPVIWLPLIILSLFHMLGMLFVSRVKTEEWPLDSVQTPPTISYTYLPVNALIIDLLSFWVSIFIIGFIVYAIAKVFRKQVSLKQIFSLSIFLQVIPILALIIQALAHVLEWGEGFFSYNLQDLLHLSTGHFSFVFGYITIFTIWNWIIAAMGFQKVISLPTIVTFVIAIVLWYLPLSISFLFVTPVG
ncbi:YIP1 family protein [Shimazuella kribbensis]|uniref:YIP1 family protein n=1 Tax=Shimazuella kribbensis TaxID=139808 RepID=UPI00041EBCF2|nr:YIP1 family protein [Shimazuella kribbensis]